MRSVLLTGATGFVGGHLLDRLVRDGARVIVAGRESSRAGTLPSSTRRIHFDLAQPDSFDAAALEGIDCIYHLAARVHVMNPSARDEDQFSLLNVRSTMVLAAAAAKAGVRRFVYLSSIKVNGERTTVRPFEVHDPALPEDAYARSKWRAECAILEIAKNMGLDVAIVRPPLVYGPGVGANFLRLLSLASRGWPLPFGGIDNRRSLVSVWNLNECLLRVGSETSLPQPVWLVSDGEDISTPKLIELMAEAMGRRSMMWDIPPRVLRALAASVGKGAEISRLVESLQIDVSQTRMALRWTPPVSLREGIARTASWYLESKRACS